MRNSCPLRKMQCLEGILGESVVYVTLYLYLLIVKRLIFESRVRDGSPSLAAAPAGPEIRPWLSARAASIISFSCLTRAPSSVAGRAGFWPGSLLSHVWSTS